jgi:hypothetical protein
MNHRQEGKMHPKRRGFELESRTFITPDERVLLVFKTPQGSYHTFFEVAAKDAAKALNPKAKGNTRAMWDKIWESGLTKFPARFRR